MKRNRVASLRHFRPTRMQLQIALLITVVVIILLVGAAPGSDNGGGGDLVGHLFSLFF